MFRRSAADLSITFDDPRLTPWATDLSPLRGFSDSPAGHEQNRERAGPLF